MILYSDLYLGDSKSNKFSRRFHDFGYAQHICQGLEDEGKPYYLLLFNEKGHVITLLTKLRIPKLQTNPH